MTGFSRRTIGLILAICGGIGLIAAFVLAVEKVELLKDPDYSPSCSINPVLSCGSVMATDQAELFGFPNPFIGVATFPVLLATGIAVAAGVTFPRWWWLGTLAGTFSGVVFISWLFFQSVFRIEALCPYCMVVWVVTITAFWYTLLHVLGSGSITVSATFAPAVNFLRTYHSTVLLAVFVALAVIIGVEFWYYWRTLLP